jgi:hypothetical protein
MATGRHIIHQQAVEISATDRNTAQPLFLEISRLFNNRAKDVAGYILDKYDRESELIKIDILEVDIGSIPFPFSEESFVKIYSEKLEEALSGTIKKQLQLAESRAQQSDPAVAKRSLLHLLEQFLLTGTIAWWAGKEELKDPIRVFKALQEKEMPLLHAMITRLFPEATVRKRLVYSFAEENIKTVIGMVQPAEKEYILRYHARVSYLQAEHHFVRTDSTGFGKVLWLFILDFLADHSGNRFNRKMFVRSTLSAIALRFNVRFEELLFFFSEALKEIPEHVRRLENLLSLVEEIALEESQKAYSKAFDQPGLNDRIENTQASKAGQALFFFLLNGFFPIGFQATDGTTLNADLINAIKQDSAYTRLFFWKHGKSILVRKRLLTHFSEASVKALIQLLEPAGSEIISSYVSFITQFQKKVHFVKTEESQFRNVLWNLILTELFSESGSAFQAKPFLVANVRAIAQEYAMDPIRLQAVLVQGTVQQDSSANSHATLFSLFTEILSENTGSKQAMEQLSLLKAQAESKERMQENIPEKELSPPEIKDAGKINIPEKEIPLSEMKDGVHVNAPEKELPLPEIKDEAHVSVPKKESSFTEMKDDAPVSNTEKELLLLKEKNSLQTRASEKELSLSEILDSVASAIGAGQKSFVLHVVLHLLEFGALPSWARAGSLSAVSFISRMRTSYPNELRTALLYAARNRKTGVSFLHYHAPLFKSDLIFLFETVFPEKLILFFQELQAFQSIPDVFFAQALLSALAESAERTPELPVFFSVLLKHIEHSHGKEAAKTVAFHAGTFSSLKGNKVLQQAFDQAVKEQVYSGIPSGMEYSALNVKQALAISFATGEMPAESELPERLIKWIKHYATYKQLPLEIKFPDALHEKKLLAWVLEFLFRNHKSQLQTLFSANQLSASEQLIFSELLQSAGAGLHVRYFVEAESRRQVLAHESANETALTTIDPESPESWQELIKKMIGQPSGSPAHTKLTTLLKQESSRTLMARYINDQDVKLVFEKGNLSDLWPWYQYFQEVALVIASEQFERQHFRKRILEFFLAVFIGHIHVQGSAKEFSLHFIRFIISKPDDTLSAIKERITKPKKIESSSFSTQAKDLMKHLSVAMNKALLGARTTTSIEKELSALEGDLYVSLDAKEKRQLQKERDGKTSEKMTDETKQQKGKALAMGEQVYVRNAGLILLHPFIATLFARAELTKDGAFTGEASQAKAVQLLQYAATGAEQEPEYELVLNKLLAGLKPEEVLVHTADLKAEEKELINGMIHAILMQWDKMKNTSLEGFRNSFLMREGYVFQTEESWVLRVEQRGYDIILQTLPWSFGMIKFSWMNKPLIVEWN